MPDRIIRDELMRSHRYVTLSSDTSRLLFVHLILSADALGNTEATTTALGIIMGRPVDTETASKWLSELADVDLIRVYEIGGKRFIHIPRYRQRLRYMTGKHPRPPANIECSELKHLLSKVGPQSDRSQSTVGPQSAEVKRSEVKRKDLDLGLSISPTRQVKPSTKKPPRDPQDPDPYRIDINRQVAQALQAGDLELAKAIKVKAGIP